MGSPCCLSACSFCKGGVEPPCSFKCCHPQIQPLREELEPWPCMSAEQAWVPLGVWSSGRENPEHTVPLAPLSTIMSLRLQVEEPDVRAEDAVDCRQWTQHHLAAADIRVTPSMALTPPQGDVEAGGMDVNVRGPGQPQALFMWERTRRYGGSNECR